LKKDPYPLAKSDETARQQKNPVVGCCATFFLLDSTPSIFYLHPGAVLSSKKKVEQQPTTDGRKSRSQDFSVVGVVLLGCRHFWQGFKKNTSSRIKFEDSPAKWLTKCYAVKNYF
jgi:hypothetical protein